MSSSFRFLLFISLQLYALTTYFRDVNKDDLLASIEEVKGTEKKRRISEINCQQGCIPFRELLLKYHDILEISPFVNPTYLGPVVKYFDVLDRQEMIAKVRELNNPFYTWKIMNDLDEDFEIDFVEPTGDLGVVNQKFDAIFSSHSMEHTLNIVKHLQQIGDIIKPDGKVFLVLPDKRFTLDVFRPLSTISDKIQLATVCV